MNTIKSNKKLYYIIGGILGYVHSGDFEILPVIDEIELDTVDRLAGHKVYRKINRGLPGEAAYGAA